MSQRPTRKGVLRGPVLTWNGKGRKRWGMPRALRIEYPGAIYHVMNRGDHREPIFRDDLDRRQFLRTLGEMCRKTEWQVHVLWI